MAHRQSPTLDKFINIQIKLRLKQGQGKGLLKRINLKLKLEDYEYLKSNGKSIKLRLNIIDRTLNLSKVANLKIKFTDPLDGGN